MILSHVVSFSQSFSLWRAMATGTNRCLSALEVGSPSQLCCCGTLFSCAAPLCCAVVTCAIVKAETKCGTQYCSSIRRRPNQNQNQKPSHRAYKGPTEGLGAPRTAQKVSGGSKSAPEGTKMDPWAFEDLSLAYGFSWVPGPF